MSITCNSLILAAILRTRSIQRPSFLLLCSLSITDVIWAIIALVDNIFTYSHKSFCPKELKWAGLQFAITLCFFSTLGNLAIISCDRFLAVSKPWWYRNHLTKSHAIKQISFVWLLSAVICGIGATAWSFPSLKLIFQLLTAVWYSLCILAMTCSYGGVLIANLRHRVAMNIYGSHMRTVLRNEKKIANTVCFILIVLCFTTLPSLIVPFVLYQLGFSKDDINPVRPFYHVLATLNGLLNPLVNYGRSDDVRGAVGMLIRCQWTIRGVRHSHREENRQRGINLVFLRGNNRVAVDARIVQPTTLGSAWALPA